MNQYPDTPATDAGAAPTAASVGILIDDRQACERYRVGLTLWHELQRREGFPKPVWLGPGTKRHVVAECDRWIATALRAPHEGAYEKKSRAGRLGVASRESRKLADRASAA